MSRRHAWLIGLPFSRANTVLVEDIPEGYRCQEKVFTFFCENVGAVAKVNMVKNTEKLEVAIEMRNSAKEKLEQRQMSSSGSEEVTRLSNELMKHEAQVKEEREHIQRDSYLAGGVNSHAAFVTFQSRKDAEMAKVLELSSNADWVVQDAPEASEIRWHDLYRDYSVARSALGYSLIFLLFANFSPICLAISTAASEINTGKLQPIWNALAPTLGLTVFLAMLPTAACLKRKLTFLLPFEP